MQSNEDRDCWALFTFGDRALTNKFEKWKRRLNVSQSTVPTSEHIKGKLSMIPIVWRCLPSILES